MKQLDKYLDAVADSFYLNRSELKEDFFKLLKEYEAGDEFANEVIMEVLDELIDGIRIFHIDIRTGEFCFNCNDNEYHLNIFTDNATAEVEKIEWEIEQEIKRERELEWVDYDLPSWARPPVRL